jgi:hypothetical protein
MYRRAWWSLVWLFAFGLYSLPLAWAGGAHEDCKMCHKDEEEDPYEFVVKIDSTTKSPNTGKPLTGVSALCLGCHSDESKASLISLEHSHPVGVTPESGAIKVPKELLEFSGEEGKLSCGSCHNWHPDNEIYMSLRSKTEIKGRYYLSSFCVSCHVDKGTAEGKGPHGQCALCHSSHDAQGPVMLTEEPNTITVNPRTGKTPDRIASLCLACHTNEPDGAGYRPINLATTHPVGVAPTKAKVPPDLMGFAGEKVITCTSCHDHHPENTNYAYLRWPIKQKADIPVFCGKCHPESKDKLTAGIANLTTNEVGVHDYFGGVESLDDYLKKIKSSAKK